MNVFVDASVIVAILHNEPGYEELEKALDQENGRFYSSPIARYEAVAALARIEIAKRQMKARRVTAEDRATYISAARDLVDDFLKEIDAREIIIDSSMGSAALDAMADYGKMAGHAADLNLGDCFAYAAAKKNRLKLLYKGDDFALTDLA